MNLLKLSLFILALCALSGCDSRPEMRVRFSQVRILTDEEGHKYVVNHNIGETYFLTPYNPIPPVQPSK